MTRVLQLQAVDSAQNVGALRHLYDEVVKNVRSLEALGVKQKQYSAQLRVAIEKRLPHELVLRYCHQKPEEADTHSTISALLDFLKKEVRSSEEAIEIASDGSTVHRKLYDKARRHCVPSVATFTTTSGSDKEPCYFCSSEEHSFTTCDKTLTLEERKNILKRSGRCFGCCKKFHRAKDCQNSRFLRCRNCQGRHFTFLCDSKYAGPSAIDTQRQFVTK
ncbi:hypothetical protein HPB48_018767 [Haemaphysalis longicornis]|uniref:Uncharacterized protein n=1 Tax=Haemaphysalis longicornis TaxID=44386 RepID=A0A9J6GKV4_HAELO|nr:hypothetical protein HPB48_018767 [Haemaphysalis longicornis]